MTANMQEQDWKTVKSKLKSKFSKLSENDIESLHGHMDKLPEKVQKAYSYTKDKAEKESKIFTDTLMKKSS